MGSWMKDLQERVRRASTEMNTALQPRMAQAKRQIEEGIEQMGLKRGKELYTDDAPLASAMAALDVVRAHVRALATNVDSQRGHLLAAAKSQRALGETLGAAAPADAQALIPGGGGREGAHTAFAEAQLAAAGAMARFALDMSTPMADLARTFEERYAASISPLKKRHATQKTEYLKFVRQARAAAEDADPARRERLETVARNAQPVCQRTSESLQDEIRSLLAHTMSSISEWMLNVAQAQAETYARASKAFEDPKQLAEKAQDTPSE